MMSCCDTGTKLLACDWFAKHLLRQARISPESERLIRTGTDLDPTTSNGPARRGQSERLIRTGTDLDAYAWTTAFHIPIRQNDSSVQERI